MIALIVGRSSPLSVSVSSPLYQPLYLFWVSSTWSVSFILRATAFESAS